MNKDEWDKSYTERNAKAEMWGGALAGMIFILVPVFAVLALLNPKILILMPMLIIWIIMKRKASKK